MSTRRVLIRAGLLALAAAYPFAVVLGPRHGLAVLLAAGLAMGNFWMMAARLAGVSALLTLPAAPGHGALTARTMIAGTIRWVLTFFLLWTLLKYAHALPVVAGLSCVVASITLQAFVDCSRVERDPSTGAGP